MSPSSWDTHPSEIRASLYEKPFWVYIGNESALLREIQP